MKFALSIFVLVIHFASWAFPAASAPGVIIDSSQGGQDLSDLAARFTESTPEQSVLFTQALSVLNLLESAPSCHRLAAHNLIDTCESLEKSTEIELALEEVKEKYAARLAMCELTGAQTSLPPQCKDFVPSPCAHEGFARLFRKRDQPKAVAADQMCYPNTSRNQVKQCLNALHSRPQWWTSYSNALQNVVVVCQATRTYKDKEEILENLKSGVKATGELMTAVDGNLKKSHDFAAAVRALQNQVLREQQEQQGHTRTFLADLRLLMQKTFHNFMESMMQGADEFSDKMSALDKVSVRCTFNGARLITAQDIDRTNSKIKDTHSIVDSLLQQADRSKTLVASQVNSLELANIHANNVADALEQFQDLTESGLSVSLQALIVQIQNFSDSMSNVEQRIDKNNAMLDKQVETIGRIQSSGIFESSNTAFLVFPVAVLLGAVFPAIAKYIAIFSGLCL
jgi:hypothetical protein